MAYLVPGCRPAQARFADIGCGRGLTAVPDASSDHGGAKPDAGLADRVPPINQEIDVAKSGQQTAKADVGGQRTKTAKDDARQPAGAPTPHKPLPPSSGKSGAKKG